MPLCVTAVCTPRRRFLQVIDPPFITREVWEKYAITARFLLAEGGRLICTTIRENAAMMDELLQARAVDRNQPYFHTRILGQAAEIPTVHPALGLPVRPRAKHRNLWHGLRDALPADTTYTATMTATVFRRRIRRFPSSVSQRGSCNVGVHLGIGCGWRVSYLHAALVSNNNK